MLHTERVLHAALKSVCNLKTASHILVYTIFRTIIVKLFIISKAVTDYQDKKMTKHGLKNTFKECSHYKTHYMLTKAMNYPSFTLAAFSAPACWFRQLTLVSVVDQSVIVWYGKELLTKLLHLPQHCYTPAKCII